VLSSLRWRLISPMYVKETKKAVFDQCRRKTTRWKTTGVVIIFPLNISYAGATTGNQYPPKDPAELGIQDTMKIKVSIVYGASKFDQKLSEAPAAVSIVTATEIKRFGYRTLADILRSVRGFYTTYDRNYHYLGMCGFCFWWMVTRSMTMFTIRPAVIIRDLLTLARRGVAAAEVVNINEMIANYIKSPIHQKLALYHPNVIFKNVESEIRQVYNFQPIISR